MGALNVIRWIIYVLGILFSLVVLAFTIFNETAGLAGSNPFDDLSLAVAVITLVCLILTLVLEATVRSGVTSLVPIEVARIGVLWPLWIASGAQWYADIPFSGNAFFCEAIDSYYDLALLTTRCAATIIIPACSMVNFFLFFVWFILVIIFASVNHYWRSPVHRVELGRKNGSEPTGTSSPFVYYQQPPQPSYWNPSQQPPPGWPPGPGSPPQQYASYGPGYQGQAFPHQHQQVYQTTPHQHPQPYASYSVNNQPVSPPAEGQQQAVPGHSPPMLVHPHGIPKTSLQGPSTDEKA